MNGLFQKIIAFFMAIGAFFTGLFGWNKKPAEPTPEPSQPPAIVEPAPLDLTGYTLYVYDEFDGDSLNRELWGDVNVGPRGPCFLSPGQISVKDGNLVFTSEYLTNDEYGEGWYTARLRLIKEYMRGYFEIRCKCNECSHPYRDFWSGFWLQSVNSASHQSSNGGIGGAEIDIMEAYHWDAGQRGSVTCNIFCNGADDRPDDYEHLEVGRFFVDNLYTEYHTFGLKWTQSEYIFYIDGKETARSSFENGVSEVPETLLLGMSYGTLDQPKDYKAEFLVDYVKVYQQGPETYEIGHNTAIGY